MEGQGFRYIVFKRTDEVDSGNEISFHLDEDSKEKENDNKTGNYMKLMRKLATAMKLMRKLATTMNLKRKGATT